MRKFIVSAIIIVLAVSAGAYYYIYHPLSDRTPMASVLPGDTLAVLRVCDLTRQVAQFRSGPMGQALGGMDWSGLLAAMGASEQERLAVAGAMESAGSAVESLWFEVLFGQDFSLGVLKGDFDPDRLAAGDLTPLLEAVVAVSRPTQPALVLESLSSMLGARLAAEPQPYEQWEITKVLLENGQPLYYAFTDGLMITGLSPEPVKTCLRQSLDPQSSLLLAETYRRHAADLFEEGRTTLLAFADLGELFSLVRDAVAETDAPGAGIQQLDTMRGLESFNFVQYDDGGDQVTARVIVGLDRAGMSPYLSRMLTRAPGPNATLALAPADALLYSWQNTFDLALYWENLQQDPDMTPEAISQIEAAILENTGMPLETLLGAFGSQAGILVNDIQTGGFFPIPELALFVETAQPEVVTELIRREVAQTGLALQEERYADTDLHYVTLPLGESLSPVFAFTDGFCLVATSRPLLKAMLDAPASGSLTANPHAGELGTHLTAESNSVFYVRGDGLVDKSRELLDWTVSWMRITQPERAQEIQAIMALGGDSLLDGLAMVQAVGGRSVIEEDRAVTEMKVLLDRSGESR